MGRWMVAQKDFKTQANKVPSLQRALACLCVTRESPFQFGLVVLCRRTSKTVTAVVGDQQVTECGINLGNL